MAETGMLPPSFAAVHSASEIVFDGEGACATTPDAQNNAAAPAPKTHKRECFIISLQTRTLSHAIMPHYRTQPRRTIVSGSGTITFSDQLRVFTCRMI
jgi:hypothetical protein